MDRQLLEQNFVADGFYYIKLLNFHESLRAVSNTIALQPSICYEFESLVRKLMELSIEQPTLNDFIFIIPDGNIEAKDSQSTVKQWWVVQSTKLDSNSYKVQMIENGSLYLATHPNNGAVVVPTKEIITKKDDQ